jgi:thioredoxin 1
MKEFIHFTAIWCNPCKQMAPVIDQFISNNPDIKYTKIDVDENTALVNEYEIKSVPTFIAKIDNQIYNKITGIATESKINSMFG